MAGPPFDLSGRDAPRDFQTLLALLNRASFLERSIVVPLRGQTAAGVGIHAMRRADTTTAESWYACGALIAQNQTAVATAPNELWAVPFVNESPYPIESIGFGITGNGAAGSKSRVGIYDAVRTQDGLLYPGTLIVEGDEAVTDAGAVPRDATTARALTLEVGALYFAAYHGGTGSPTIRRLSAVTNAPVLGASAPSAASWQVAWQAALTYDTSGLPATFPSGATIITSGTSLPAVYLRHGYATSRTRRHPGEYVDREGMVLKRVLLVAPFDVAEPGSAPWFTIDATLRTGSRVEKIGTFDSRRNRIKAGTPFPLSPGELDRALRVGDTPEVTVTQYGFPWKDLSDLMVRYVLAYGGGAD